MKAVITGLELQCDNPDKGNSPQFRFRMRVYYPRSDNLVGRMKVLVQRGFWRDEYVYLVRDLLK